MKYHFIFFASSKQYSSFRAFCVYSIYAIVVVPCARSMNRNNLALYYILWRYKNTDWACSR